jgi:small subunit ribosomal protein S23
MQHDRPKEGEPTDAQSRKERAYDKARKEFYKIRLEEDVERQVAREEALMVGGYFGKTQIEIGLELEEKQWQRWKTWALKEIERQGYEQAAAASNARIGMEIEESQIPVDDTIVGEEDEANPV